MGIARPVCRPLLDDCEVVRVIRLRKHFVADIAIVPGGVDAHCVEQRQAVDLVLLKDVDVGQDIDCARSIRAIYRAAINAAADAFVAGRNQNLFEFVAEVLAALSWAMNPASSFQTSRIAKRFGRVVSRSTPRRWLPASLRLASR
jgi:hypothetical protein